MIEHRGIRGVFTPEAISEFNRMGIDYVAQFKQSVDEAMEEDDEVKEEDNPYR
jgi:hypothetical protein